MHIWIRTLVVLSSLGCPSLTWGADAQRAERPPNVVLIVADDLGWGDVGFNGCKEIPTPHLDELAASGVRFSAGYASHPYCSPSRAGLLTGRHQQRFGHESNPGRNDTDGLPLSEVLLSDILQKHGYRTGAIGKWHLGDAPRYWPTQRGFDEWFGFSGGGMNYWGHPRRGQPLSGVLRNGEPVPESEISYLTDDFSQAAVKFIQQNQKQPFFLYLAYNAPHSPDQVTRKHLNKTSHIEYGGRAVYGAMVAGMDAGIGQVMQALHDCQLRQQTLVVFFSDNGGRKEHAVNFPYRGHKGMLFEGGIRVPFCVSWPSRIPAGQNSEMPVTGLDVVPTALAAAGVKPPDGFQLDGMDLLPFLQHPDAEPPQRGFVWRYAVSPHEFGYAVRDGGFKLVYSKYKNRKLLFDLEEDPYEQHDLAAEYPEQVTRLSGIYDRWAKQMLHPRWLDPHGENVRKEEAARQGILDQATQGEKLR